LINQPIHVPLLLVNGVGIRIEIIDMGTKLAELCKKTRHGFVLEHEGTTFHINTTKHPNVWFHVSLTVPTKTVLKDAIHALAINKAFWLESYLGIATRFVQQEIDEAFDIRSIYVPISDWKIIDEPFALPGKLSEADLDRLAGEYPPPEPGKLVLPAKPGLQDAGKAAIVDIIKKYNDWSFEQLCKDWAMNDAEGGCGELCGNKIDGGDPACCPMKDFRALVRILGKAFPHEKARPTFGGYY
jgi:hypothetical protein